MRIDADRMGGHLVAERGERTRRTPYTEGSEGSEGRDQEEL